MRNADIARDMVPRGLDAANRDAADAGARFTPAAFFKDAGTVIAICLGLGLLAQLLLG